MYAFTNPFNHSRRSYSGVFRCVKTVAADSRALHFTSELLPVRFQFK